MNKSLKDFAQLVGKCLASRWMRLLGENTERRERDVGVDSPTRKSKIVPRKPTEKSKP